MASTLATRAHGMHIHMCSLDAPFDRSDKSGKSELLGGGSKEGEARVDVCMEREVQACGSGLPTATKAEEEEAVAAPVVATLPELDGDAEDRGRPGACALGGRPPSTGPPAPLGASCAAEKEMEDECVIEDFRCAGPPVQANRRLRCSG